MLRKINLLTLISAIVLFFLPWIDIRCSGQAIATQTGLQTIYGGASPSDQMEAMAKETPSRRAQRNDDDSLGWSPVIAVALLAILAGTVFAFLALRHGDSRHDTSTSLFATLGLILIAIQMAAGFPAGKALSDSMAREANSNNDPMTAGLAGATLMNFDIRPLPALYLELAVLGIPTLIGINGLLDRLKKQP
ncbi:hypothetical protein KBB96_08775 [Luteolibacter ambystomatis]|uniref:Uncharacterized protein n=1 Tax=Luteolibacter ambystomatis TaxID=2824561 RepID=A0A975J2X0_9BACT|nr:hypothetical protein [Luteolibacter ambystomatis]QUE52971.1 hypothetical protein KBB96_08775 [Luteolibacter ambystomatis]